MDRPPSPTLKFVFHDGAISVSLVLGGTPVETFEIPPKGHLDEVLIPTLDDLLKRHRIDPLVLGKATIIAEAIDRNSSAYRIVHTWAAALKTAQNHNK